MDGEETPPRIAHVEGRELPPADIVVPDEPTGTTRSWPKRLGYLVLGLGSRVVARLLTWRRTLFAVGLAAGGLAALWAGLFSVLAADKGLDVTDEGLYLLAADPSQPHASSGIPWGWHTRPLFWVVGRDIAGFRTLGAVLLFLGGGALGVLAVAATQKLSRAAADFTPRTIAVYRVLGAVIGALAVLVFYAGLLSTPGYNWLTLFGLIVAAAGISGVVVATDGTLDVRGWRARASVAVVAFGIIAAVPAKATAVILLVIACIALWVAIAGPRRSAAAMLHVLAVGTGLVVLAVVTRLWPFEFWGPLLRLRDGPAIDPSHTPTVALSRWLSSPRAIASGLRASGPPVIALLLVGVGLIGFGRWSARMRILLSVVGFWLVVAAALTMTSAWLPFRLGRDAVPLNRSAFSPLSIAGSVVLGAATLAVLVTMHPRAPIGRGLRGGDRGASSRAWVVPAFVAALPWMYAFGTSVSTLNKVGSAAGLLFLAAMVTIAVHPDGRVRAGLTAALLLVVSSTLGVTFVESRDRPYRRPPVATQNEEITFVATGSRLRADADLAFMLTSLQTQAEASGWVGGTPLLGVTWRWPSTVPYFLDAHTPQSLVVTLFGYPGSVAWAEYSLDHELGDFPLPEAWILTSASTTLDEHAQAMVTGVLAMAAERGAAPFPNGYECVAAAGELRLWRPANSTSGAELTDVRRAEASCPAPVPAASSYSMSSGWSPS